MVLTVVCCTITVHPWASSDCDANTLICAPSQYILMANIQFPNKVNLLVFLLGLQVFFLVDIHQQRLIYLFQYLWQYTNFHCWIRFHWWTYLSLWTVFPYSSWTFISSHTSFLLPTWILLHFFIPKLLSVKLFMIALVKVAADPHSDMVNSSSTIPKGGILIKL